MPDAAIRQVVEFAIGGGWGQELEFEDSVPVRVIRGTDFERIRKRDYSGVPRRYEKTSKVERRLLRPGDIILEISGGSRTSNQSTGRTFLISEDVLDELGEPAIPASFCRLVRFSQDAIDAQYAYYLLQEMYLSGRAALYEQQSTGISNFQFEYFLDSEVVPLPPLEEQRAIARMLGALDDKIELNRRMSETLEEMARALFRSWFVDFDPVRAKAEGRPSGLPPDLDALFPASFEASELGEIPAGWEVRSLDDTATFTNGLALQRFPPEGDEWLPVIKIAEMKRGYTDRTAKASADIDGRYIVDDGDVLFSWSGSLEMVLWSHGRGALNQHLFKVTSDQFPRWFYWGWTSEHLDDFRGIAAGKATTMGHIQRHHLTDAKIVVPPHNVLAAGEAHLAAMVEQQVHHAVQSRALAEQRDALLPRLISGDVRVAHSTMTEIA